MSHRVRLVFRLLWLVTSVNLVVGLLVWSLMYFVWPDSYFQAFPIIPVFFWLVGIGMAVSLEMTRTEKPDAVTMTYMVARGIKLLLTAIFIGFYAWFVHTDLKQFGLTTLAFYMIYLVLETYVFYLYEKRRNKRRRKLEGDKLPQPDAYAGKDVEKDEVDV